MRFRRSLASQAVYAKSSPQAKSAKTPIVVDAAEYYASERGAIFTKREVVDFILDLAGYDTDQPLHLYRLLEPSFGEGAFLLPAVERLLISYARHVKNGSRLVETLAPAICAVEIHRSSIEKTCDKLRNLLQKYRVSRNDTRELLNHWIIEGDFLRANLTHPFTHAVGNPPYVRQELIPEQLITQYRQLYKTIYDRADLYVPFIERCLSLLVPSGVLGFICADRWMKNKYGRRLREMVADNYHLAYYVDMVDTPAFHSEVSAYPAITIIRREKPGPSRIAHRPGIDRAALANLSRALMASEQPKNGAVIEVNGVAQGGDPWILHSFDQLAVVRRLEADFPSLEDAGCKVGIGVATGADKIFTGPFDKLPIEADRKLPLVKTSDVRGGGIIKWQGNGVINPFREDGSLVDLKDYPKLKRYFKRYSRAIRRRNCAKKNTQRWYRTIDRIYPQLVSIPKLLIPDIRGKALIAYDAGHYYPHHNLYYITSGTWDLRALQAILQSGIARLFVAVYSTRMRGGYLRFQAQYLRRIRLPRWKDVPPALRSALVRAALNGDFDACNRATFDLYRLTPSERAAIGGNGD